MDGARQNGNARPGDKRSTMLDSSFRTVNVQFSLLADWESVVVKDGIRGVIRCVISAGSLQDATSPAAAAAG